MSEPNWEYDGSFVQTFATTLLLKYTALPELTFVSLPIDPNMITDVGRSIEELGSEFAEFEDEDKDELGELHINEAKFGKGELIKQMIVMHLVSGLEELPSRSLLIRFEDLAEAIYEKAEIPVKSSPINGVTLSSLVGGAGVAGVLQLFHSGVTPGEAVITVLFLAGTMVILGAANGVRRALDAGLEQKVLKVFGATDDAKYVGNDRDWQAKRKRIARRRAVPPDTI